MDGSNVYAGGTCRYRNGGTCGSDEGPGYWLNGNWNSVVYCDTYPCAGCSATPWQISSIVVSGGTVKAAGYKEDSSYNKHYGYWSNHNWLELFTISGSSRYRVGSAYWIGTDLYASGSRQYDSTTSIPGYMQNGIWVDLVSPVNCGVSQLVIAGTDIYAAGGTSGSNATAGDWLNGTWTAFKNPANTTSEASCIAVSGSDIYVAGDRNTSGRTEPGYWLNGSWNSFAPPAGTYTYIKRIIISGSNIYFLDKCVVSGVYQAGYWLNGSWVGIPLPPYANASEAMCMVVSDGDVYVGGYGILPGNGDGIPGYWKNGAWVGF